ncbi:hypothetical protein SAMN05421853_107191 [Roseivivax halotolerans]|jgi:hypothetical protein|uniref:Uncharacterized protein n=1 Tax=Roseivivax halotolerans TaxID=93684 RepID=A0A1I5Z320_9RHOB|nr:MULTISPECIES: hypothetical protein [Roseivivax]QFT61546.1 hypothetical protein FIU91_01290 [Roseivivax sp. THAF30]SFQ50715.1 hypothetical protein SAMN05421853_107191 [Roseivivax halotolerans]
MRTLLLPLIVTVSIATGASAGITAPQLPYLWFPDSAPTEPQPAQDGAAETR